MALFRPYKPGEGRRDPEGTEQTPEQQRPRSATTPRREPAAAAQPTTSPGTPATADVETPAGGRKNRPTPTRREAEAARRERLNPTISKKEARRRAAEANRRTRMEQMAARDATPAKVLLRDHVDARFNLGEVLLPVLLLIVLATFLQTALPQIVVYSTIGMYVFILLVVLDFVRMWRAYKRIAAERGIALEKGLRLYGMNRMIQLRRMRLPKPQVKRGESY
ncbi:DUF3043 domain-containing protein [Desertihabitans brevis]|uniref:DUF3043 domain-containing protein n=1 Tax=Desertihabitans brevis TaxID=2268447 RepID=A0A367YUP6_9ACTN|nr:DUF3043 domain-containing protein [Desertihabitans brevis]RCK69520.1 DUF3043 domain-containing protein [Desertihabitans brevis]